MRAGWQTKNLGDVCEVIGGGTPSKDNPAYYLGEIPWATVRDMRQEVITETECQITKEAVKSSATNIIPSGNVVIATRVGLGKVCLLGQDTAINQDLRGIIPRNPNVLLVRFLFWWFKSIADVIVAEGTGATVQGVKLPFVKSLPLPVPPLSNSTASSPSSTKPSTASPPPKPTPKRTSRTPAPCLKATCNPFSRSGVRGGWSLQSNSPSCVS
ncbi:MAG: restriction endonuclease subunit S [Gammaproteobacteria bacterium]|nr:restriction endonuclease subunit S [Gammaproteobacteria bacterium]